jgi:hypothetical protein
MNDTQTDRDFLFALDYILNRANVREIDAFAAAIERRQGQINGVINGSMPFTPEEAAKKMSESIYASIDASMDGVRHTFRDYAADILQKEAPELSKEQIIGLVDSWIPQSSGVRGKNRRASLVKNGSVQGIPADLLYEMVIQFVSYSLGEMSVETQRSLTAAMHNWTESYWRRFPTGIKQEIKAFLNGETTSGEFQGHLCEMLSLT